MTDERAPSCPGLHNVHRESVSFHGEGLAFHWAHLDSQERLELWTVPAAHVLTPAHGSTPRSLLDMPLPRRVDLRQREDDRIVFDGHCLLLSVRRSHYGLLVCLLFFNPLLAHLGSVRTSRDVKCHRRLTGHVSFSLSPLPYSPHPALHFSTMS